MADVDPLPPPPWAGGVNIDPNRDSSAWMTAVGRELTATRTLLQEGTHSDARKAIVDGANAILIGASLIASITYASWLLLPYDNIVHKKAVKVFWAFNSLSFFFAVATVLGCASAAMPNFAAVNVPNMDSSNSAAVNVPNMDSSNSAADNVPNMVSSNSAAVDVANRVSDTMWRLQVASFLFLTSVEFVLGAFASAAFVIVPHQQDTYFIHDTIIVPIIAGGTIIGVAGMVYFSVAMY